MFKRIALATLFIVSIGYGQKIDDVKMSFKYVRLPLNPVGDSIRNYSTAIKLAYLEKVIGMKQKAEDEFRKAEADYPSLVQQAEENYIKDSIAYQQHKAEAELQYKKDMEAYEQKSVISKIVEKKVLLEDNTPQLNLKYARPYRQVPPKPVLVYPEELKYLKVLDTNRLATTYLTLDGYEKKEGNSLRIVVTIHEFEYKEPELKTRETKEMTKNDVIDVIMYSNSYPYRQPMVINVFNPDGSQFAEVAPAELNEFRLYRTPENKSEYALPKKADVLNMLMDKIVEDNMVLIGKEMNRQFGKTVIERKTILYNVLPKKNNKYDDYKSAFDNAFTAYNQMSAKQSESRALLQKSVDLWEKALTESDPQNRKSRVNNDVTMVTHFNCAEAYIWLNRFDKAQEHIARCQLFKPNRKEQQMIAVCKELLDDQNKRYSANKE